MIVVFPDHIHLLLFRLANHIKVPTVKRNLGVYMKMVTVTGRPIIYLVVLPERPDAGQRMES